MSLFDTLYSWLYWIFLGSSILMLIWWFIKDTKTARVLYSEGTNDFKIIKNGLKDMKFYRYKGKDNEKIWDLSQTKPKMLMTNFGMRPFFRIDKDNADPIDLSIDKEAQDMNPEFNSMMIRTKIFKDIMTVQNRSDDYMIWAMVGGAGALLGYILQPMIANGLV